MKIIEPSVEIISPTGAKIDGIAILKHIERCGRTCYQSEHNITQDSYLNFAKRIINNGHESVLEHYSFTVKFICDRGISHQIVRHRIASMSQESTRYNNYTKDKFENELTFIKPFFIEEGSPRWHDFKNAMQASEDAYFRDINEFGATPEEARGFLPHFIKTELVMTANIREWRTFFKLRTSLHAHPQMREVAIPLLRKCQVTFPVVFDDITI